MVPLNILQLPLGHFEATFTIIIKTLDEGICSGLMMFIPPAQFTHLENMTRSPEAVLEARGGRGTHFHEMLKSCLTDCLAQAQCFVLKL